MWLDITTRIILLNLSNIPTLLHFLALKANLFSEFDTVILGSLMARRLSLQLTASLFMLQVRDSYGISGLTLMQRNYFINWGYKFRDPHTIPTRGHLCLSEGASRLHEL